MIQSLLLLWAHISALAHPVQDTSRLLSVERVWSVGPSIARPGTGADSLNLSLVAGVALGPDEALYVSDLSLDVVVAFSSDGIATRILGRTGDGPGEFRTPFYLGFLSDTLWVSDLTHRRVTMFRRDGGVIATLSMASQGAAPYTSTPPARMLKDGSGISLQGAAAGSGVTSLPFVRLARDGSVLGLVARLPMRRSQFTVRNDLENGMTFLKEPFADDPLFAFGPADDALYQVLRPVASSSGTADFTIRKMTPVGDTLFESHVSYRPVRLNSAQVSNAVDMFVRGLVTNARVKAFTSEARAREAIRHAMWIPEFLPPVTDIVIAVDGHIWVRREELGEHTIWWILDPSGRLIGRFSLPSSVQIKAVAGRSFWGVELDSDDLPHLQRYRIVGG